MGQQRRDIDFGDKHGWDKSLEKQSNFPLNEVLSLNVISSVLFIWTETLWNSDLVCLTQQNQRR